MKSNSKATPKPTLPLTSAHNGLFQVIAEDVYSYTDKIVNVFIVGNPEKDQEWFLVDCGISKSSEPILSMLTEHFGDAYSPKMIVLTHGHFDHIGAANELANHWGVPIYCHPLELPFLTGKQDYPKPDPTVEGGMVAKLSGAFPYEAIDLSPLIHSLGTTQRLEAFPEWQWIHTPGHSPGQIALYREKDGTLLSADAIITVKQDSLYEVLTQSENLQGPPRYFTTDWSAAKRSVETLVLLNPQTIGPGHGLPMSGEEVKHGLPKLLQEFDQVAVPDYGKYT